MPYDQQTPGARKVRGLIRRVLGAEPVRVWPTDSPDAKFAELSGGHRVVVKWPEWRNDEESLRAEAWAYRRCREAGLRVPRVVAVSAEPACLIIEVVPGESLADRVPADPDVRRGWAEAGAQLRALHELRVPGFGPLRVRDDEARGSSDRWCPFVDEARDRGVPWLVDRGFVQPAAGDALVRRLGEAGPWLGAVGDGRLLHGDLSGGHVIFDAGRDVRLIDFGQAQVGDPRWDLARILLWDGDPALEALLDGYGHDLMTAEERRTVLPLYLFAYCSHHVVGHPNDGHIARVLDLSRWRELL